MRCYLLNNSYKSQPILEKIFAKFSFLRYYIPKKKKSKEKKTRVKNMSQRRRPLTFLIFFCGEDQSKVETMKQVSY